MNKKHSAARGIRKFWGLSKLYPGGQVQSFEMLSIVFTKPLVEIMRVTRNN